jgi:hypothetical protein
MKDQQCHNCAIQKGATDTSTTDKIASKKAIGHGPSTADPRTCVPHPGNAVTR